MKRRPNGYWTEENIEKELRGLIENLGRFPTQADMRQSGVASLAMAISKLGKSVSEWEARLGLTPRQRPKGYWNKWENLEKEILPHVADGKFPTLEMLKHAVGSRIANVVAEFGGINEVAERMGYAPPTFFVATDGHYINSANEYLVDEFLWSRGISHEVDGIIVEGRKYRYDFRVGSYFVEVWGYESGRTTSKICDRYHQRRQEKERLYREAKLPLISIELETFKQPLPQIEQDLEIIFSSCGFDCTKKEATYSIENSAKHCRFWNEDKIDDELKVYIEADGNFPSKTILEKERPDLTDAIGRHGGFIHFRERLGTELLQRAKGSWNESAIVSELQKVIQETGSFPTYTDLKSRGQYDLVRAINRHGGYVHYQKLIGCDPKKKTGDFWTEEEMTRQLRELADKLGRFPKYSEVMEHNKTLCSAIDRSKLGLRYFLNKVSV